MLRYIPPLLTPALFKVMMEMGHGETLLLCDANYPGTSGGGERIVLTNCTVLEVLEAVLVFFPLDVSVACAATVMASSRESGCFARYQPLVERCGSGLKAVERYEFYACAGNAAAKVITTDFAKGGNILLQKGVVSAEDTARERLSAWR